MWGKKGWSSWPKKQTQKIKVAGGVFSRQQNKHFNKKIYLDGIILDSKLETELYLYLKELVNLGVKRNLRPKLRYELHGVDGSTVCIFIPDFTIFDVETNRDEVWEAKGQVLEPYPLKKKLFMAEYKEIPFFEIKRDKMNRLLLNQLHSR